LLVSLFLLLNISARENPFFPTEGEVDIPITSNSDTSRPPLKRATITLPPEARVIKNVTISYKNLDGSIEKRAIELDHSIDWHLPIFISQSYTPIVNKTKNSTTKSSKKSEDFKKIASFKYAKFYTFGKNLKIITEDKMIRNFLLVQPHRIVMDFKKDVSLKSYIKNIDGIFTKIRVGNHNGYYRVVVELDGYYRYKMKHINGAYIFKLK